MKAIPWAQVLGTPDLGLAGTHCSRFSPWPDFPSAFTDHNVKVKCMYVYSWNNRCFFLLLINKSCECNTFWFSFLKTNSVKWFTESPGDLEVRIPSFHCYSPGSVPGGETEIPQAAQPAPRPKKRKKIKWFVYGARHLPHHPIQSLCSSNLTGKQKTICSLSSAATVWSHWIITGISTGFGRAEGLIWPYLGLHEHR